MATAAPMPTARWRHRAVARHTRTQVLGLLLVGGAIAFTLAAALAARLPLSDASFLLPAIAAPVLGAVLAWRFGTWAKVIGLLLGLATVAMSFFLIFGVFVPASFVEFTSGVAYLLGALLFLYGGIAAIVRRGELETEPQRSELLLDRTVLGIVVLAFVVSLPLWLVNRTSVDTAAAAGLPEVSASNFEYSDLSVTAGTGTTSLLVSNEDPFFHTFTIDELGIDVQLLPGSSAIVELPAEAGTYTYYCIPHSFEDGAGEDDMAATLTIE